MTDQIKHDIALGRLIKDEKLPTVRQLAKQLAINPNTIAKAYRQLEQEGIIVTKPGAGTRPADRDPVDERVVKSVRERTGTIPASQDDVGGWPKLAENRRKLIVPENPTGDGYTNLEEWLHGYVAEVEGRHK